MKDVIKQLKALKQEAVKPQASWVEKNRAILLSQIKNTVSEESNVSVIDRIVAAFSIFMPEGVVLAVVRPVAVLLIVALTAPSLYYGTVKASESALPGEGLYEAKRYTEKLQVTVASIMGDPKKETQLHVEFAKRRAEETKKIISDPSKISQVSRAVADLKTEINSVNAKLEVNKKALPAEVAKEIKQNTEVIKVVLQDAKNDLLVKSDKNLAAEVKEAKDLVQDVSVKAVGVLVEKHLEGDTTVTKEDVKNALSSTAESSLDSVAVSKVSIEGVKSALETAKYEMNELAGLSVDPAVVSSSKQVQEKITTVITETSKVSNQTDAMTADALKTAGEVQQLLTSDNLSQALDKVIALSQVSKEVETASDSAVNKTQTLLPEVQKATVSPTGGTSAMVEATTGTTGTVSTAPATTGTTTTGTATGTVKITTTTPVGTTTVKSSTTVTTTQ